MRLKYYLLAIFCVLMCACKAPKDVIYFQGIDDLTPDELAEMSQTYTIKIENDDLLSINVTAWDPLHLLIRQCLHIHHKENSH
jgi:polysaccharide export outer membrane protein